MGIVFTREGMNQFCVGEVTVGHVCMAKDQNIISFRISSRILNTHSTKVNEHPRLIIAKRYLKNVVVSSTWVDQMQELK